MASDSDLLKTYEKKPDDMTMILRDVASKVNYKMAIIVFIIFLIINSDVFNARILTRFKGTREGMSTIANTRGTVIGGILLVIVMICVDALSRADML